MRPAEFSLDDRVAVVTGASSGLGRRFAQVLSQAGAGVVIAARRVERLEELAEELDESLVVQCDVESSNDRDRLMDEAFAWRGRLDVLVNNAGTTHVAPATEETPEQFADVLAVNLVAPFALSSAFAKRNIADNKRGAIVNIASVNGLVGNGQIPQASYHASKGGLVNLTRELAAQWARAGIRVNALAPGYFESELTQELFADERSKAWISKKTPLGRPGAAGELDAALLFLASEASSYVTGQVLAVDGGWTAV